MTTTAGEIARDAIRELGILDATEEPSAEDMRDTLRVMNGMMNRWAVEGVDVGHMDLKEQDAFPFDYAYERPVAVMLAKEAANIFNEPVTAKLLQEAADSWAIIQAGYIEAPRTEFDRALTRLPSQRLFGIATTT